MATGLFESQRSQTVIVTEEIEPVAGTTGSDLPDFDVEASEVYHMGTLEKISMWALLILLPFFGSFESFEW